MSRTGLCCGCGLDTASSLACPVCKSKGEIQIFCSQDCFHANWKTHSRQHTVCVTIQSRFRNFRFTGELRPWPITPQKRVPSHIACPDYATDGEPKSEADIKSAGTIRTNTPEQIKLIRKASVLGRKALDYAASLIAPGVTTDDIDSQVHDFIIKHRAYPSPLNYYGFPKSVCTSVNEVVCHGIPDKRPLKDGDIINIDISVYLNGVHSDLNATYFVGEVDDDSRRLVKGTYMALMETIKQCKPGMYYREIGNLINKIADDYKLSVVRTYCGHGVGLDFHSLPNVPHYRNNKAIGILRPGHVFTIEPMLNLGSWRDVKWPDDWTAVTVDGKRSAQFEHTLLVTDTGVEVLTRRLPTSPPLQFDV
ncbi:Methionine aminopeptidase 1 [Babesia sp. Xinjiang]|uniref:Methionine aminopeptidase 1 n=1 Tax=Babesia sp. Xinjiang TaxID=462227 RepID=UPI000A2443DC|nr:Methionine aminopeptidase 1 [Babesia sp. Xinjiang]ORM40356.1 Methionine aminopeptidase 1 [Babesia sp. Xinjiang]